MYNSPFARAVKDTADAFRQILTVKPDILLGALTFMCDYYEISRRKAHSENHPKAERFHELRVQVCIQAALVLFNHGVDLNDNDHTVLADVLRKDREKHDKAGS